MTQAAPVDLANELSKITEFWSPRIVGQVNDQFVKVARLHGEFTWHSHQNEDELFFVINGELLIQFEDRADVRLKPGQLTVVPRGVRHNPVAKEPVDVMLIETVTTAHTGDDIVPGLTRSVEEQLGR